MRTVASGIRASAAVAALSLAVATGLLAAPEVAPPPPVPPTPGEAPAAPEAPLAPRAWLGVFLEDAADGGVHVVAVVPASPAERGGVKPGDLVVSVNGKAVVDRLSLQRLLDGAEPGREIVLGTLSGGNRRDKIVIAGTREEVRWIPPALAPFPPEGVLREDPFERAGLDVQPIPGTLAEHYGAGTDDALLVTRVRPQSPADKAGMRVGDVIGGTGRASWRDPAEFEEALGAAGPRGITLAGTRARQAKSWTILLPTDPEEAARQAATQDRIRALEAEIARTRAALERLEAQLAALKRSR